MLLIVNLSPNAAEIDCTILECYKSSEYFSVSTPNFKVTQFCLLVFRICCFLFPAITHPVFEAF